AKTGVGERVWPRETVCRRQDGETFHVSMTASPIHDGDGLLIGVSAIARDITEQHQARAAAELLRKADDLEQANRTLESFTYSVAHDPPASLRALRALTSALIT